MCETGKRHDMPMSALCAGLQQRMIALARPVPEIPKNVLQTAATRRRTHAACCACQPRPGVPMQQLLINTNAPKSVSMTRRRRNQTNQFIASIRHASLRHQEG